MSDGKPLMLDEDTVRGIESARVQYTVHRAEKLRALPGNPAEVAIARFGDVVAVRRPPDHDRVMLLDAAHEDRIDEILAFFFEAWRSPDFDVLPLPGNASLLKHLAGSGWYQCDFRSVLAAPPEDVAAEDVVAGSAPGVTVTRVEGPLSDAWIDLSCQADGRGDRGEEWETWKTWLRVQHEGDAWRLFQAERDGELVGVATSFCASGGVAYFSDAVTDPDCRFRGVHSALIAARARQAVEDGCALIAADTRPYSPAQHSLTRAGLLLAYQWVRWCRSSA